MIMTKAQGLIMLRFDPFVQCREAHLKEEQNELGRTNRRSGLGETAKTTPQPQILEHFVVLEGLDGSGTTTQLLLADEALDSLGIPHLCTGEPTKGPIGRIVRRILKKQLQAEPQTVALLFAADRNEHLYAEHEGILSHLQRGELVVCDRYLFSSLAYQSLSCDPEFVYALNRDFPLPRHLVFLNTPIAVSQQRLSSRSADTPELYDGPDIQQDILSAYERGFQRFAGMDLKVHRLNGSEDPQQVFEKFWSILSRLPIVTR
jgi:dTMP kinase